MDSTTHAGYNTRFITLIGFVYLQTVGDVGISPPKAADPIACRHQEGVPRIRRWHEVDEEGRKVGRASSSAQGHGNIDGKSA